MALNTMTSILENRELIWQMALRDLKGGSKGTLLGLLWIAISPLVQVTAYVIIVSFIFKAKLSGDASPFDYSLFVLSGMIPWQIMSRSICEAPMLIRSNTELVKQVIYPIETLPLTNLLVGSFGGAVNFTVFLILFAVAGKLEWTLVFLPLHLFFLLIFLLGISWIFSIAGVILKDLREIVSVMMMLLIYFSPVIIGGSMVGGKIWSFILLNPLSHIIISFRDVLWGSFHPWSWLIFLVVSIGIFILGQIVITKAKKLINEYT
jgi:lipopolysaccharide transport system permease protein